MANVEVNVHVNSDGAVSVKKDMESIGDAAGNSGKKVNSLKAELQKLTSGFNFNSFASGFSKANAAISSTATVTDRLNLSLQRTAQRLSPGFINGNSFAQVQAKIAQTGSGLTTLAVRAQGVGATFGRMGAEAVQATSQIPTLFQKAGASIASFVAQVGKASSAVVSFTGRLLTAKSAVTAINSPIATVGKTANGSAAGVANLAAQFNDIGVTAAMGQSPLAVAIQQGTQISQVFGNMGAAAAVKMLGRALLAVISPLSLIVISIVGLITYGIQLVNWTKVFDSALKILNATLKFLATNITLIRPLIAGLAIGLALLYAPALIAGIWALSTAITVGLYNSIFSLFRMVLTNPITVALMAIGYAIAFIVEETIGWKTVLSAVVAAFKSYAAAVTPILKATWFWIKENILPALSDLKDMIIALWKEWKPFLKEVWDGWVLIWEELKKVGDQLGKQLWPIIKTSLQGWMLLLKELWKIAKDVFGGWILIIQKVIDVVNVLISALKLAWSFMQKTKTGAGGGAGGGGATGGAAAANYGGRGYAGEFANGGGFKVNGSGSGRDTTPVSFRANRGERVTVETKRQQRINDAYGAQAAPDVNVPVKVVNLLDPEMMVASLGTEAGVKAVVNIIKASRDEINLALGVV